MKLNIQKAIVFTFFVVISGLFSQQVLAQESDTDIESINISELKNYTESFIKGTVVKILDEDEFRLKDTSGKIKVYTGWKNTNLVKKGEVVTVKGKLDPGFFKEFYASEIIMEDGKKIVLQPDS